MIADNEAVFVRWLPYRRPTYRNQVNECGALFGVRRPAADSIDTSRLYPKRPLSAYNCALLSGGRSRYSTKTCRD